MQSLGFLELALIELGEFGLDLLLVGFFFESNALLLLLMGLFASGFFSLILGPIGLVLGSKLFKSRLFILLCLLLGLFLLFNHLQASLLA